MKFRSLVCALAILVPVTAGAQQQQAPAPESLFEQAIHDYLLRHPEVLMEMTQRLQQIQGENGYAQHKAELVDNAQDPVVGNPKGDVTVVVFFDYQCPACKMLGPEIDKLLASDKGVKVVYKDYPILGPGSLMAAKAALASMSQGGYEAFHNALLNDKTSGHNLGEPRILEIATSVGLNADKIKAEMKSPQVDAAVTRNIALGDQVAHKATPGMFVGSQFVPGAASFEQLTQLVAKVRGENKNSAGEPGQKSKRS
ncbi:MAG: DsbA family protein [Desulfovibrio sp.]|uniref:DsbA family protein n=1 Tax=Desulfovibrio sp. TaxID=885 RepID=UPI00135EC1C2|nr:DsbA family protein [Desulfovibrio sp.]MTJ94214.1 DsbA family protein [Desulfovibrio sp.]